LEIAIAALETLRQDQKTVGVISHVGLLKERMSTQIVVEKLAGGVSEIRIVA
jgi:exonuclease SbcC